MRHKGHRCNKAVHMSHEVRLKAGGGGAGMTPVCSWRRLLASRHLPLPLP